MMTDTSPPRPAILLVDDELQSLKYFTKAFSDDYEVHTAASVADARVVLTEHGQRVCIVMADQRMPKESGVDLLEYVRVHYPHIVRIFTTAYSDLSSAVEAVNTGGAFWYVDKPWDIAQLSGILQRAMEFFEVRQQRDKLLENKLSVAQGLIVIDRIRTLVAIAAVLDERLRDTFGALRAYVDQANLIEGRTFECQELFELDLFSLARTESRAIIDAVHAVIKDVPAGGVEQTEVDPTEILSRCVDRLSHQLAREEVKIELKMDSGLPPLSADAVLLDRLLSILVRRMSDMDGEDLKITFTASPCTMSTGGSGVRILLLASDRQWDDGQVASLYSAAIPRTMGFDMDILAAFFLTYHHGGQLLVHKEAPLGPGFELLLPHARESQPAQELDLEWFDRIYSRIERRMELPSA